MFRGNGSWFVRDLGSLNGTRLNNLPVTLFQAAATAKSVLDGRAHPIDGRLFNEMGYGSYLDWALYPGTQVFVDPRVELYPLAIWQDYLAIRDAHGYNELLID